MTRYLTNPLLVFLVVWTIAGVSYSVGVYVGFFPETNLVGLGAVLLNLLTFTLGYSTWMLFKGTTPWSNEIPVSSSRSLSRDQAGRILIFCLLMGVVALALGLYRVAMIASQNNLGFVELIKHPADLRLKLVIYITESLSRTSFFPILLSLTSSFFAIGFVLLGVFLCVDDTRTKYVYLGGFLLVGLGVGLTNMSRYEVTVNILYLIFSYGVTFVSRGDKTRRHVVRDIVWPLTAVAVLFAAIDILLNKGGLYGHSDRLRGSLFSFYWYLTAPIAAFNDFVMAFDGRYDWGQNLFFPFYKWLHRFSLVPEPHGLFYGEKTYLPYMTNVYTYLRSVYEDFGILGVAIVPYLLGWLTCAIRPIAPRNLAFLNLYMVLLVLITFSFYNYFLMSNQIYLQVFFGFVFFRRDLGSLCSDAESFALASGT